ncbi:Hypothetical protein CINCED_3A014876 [Cinara cedri]|uniref:ARID domain-containing protein n=2 Tax=Cinara cedri TaxID=506608 RepID=A0A5E4NM75_9HEMI|nr:Hypothetical protein CINCED_3A014876 [Cinara cedri]
MVNLDEPPFLAVGTEVSAKYKGTFCEAKIKKITKSVKCKVQYDNGSTTLVSDEIVKGPLKVGATVEVKCTDKKELVGARIKKIQDCSQYTVVFNDGDVTCLKRTALYLKTKRDSDTNSKLPLNKPENNCIPMQSVVYSRRNRQSNQSSGQEKISTEMDNKDIGKVVCVESNDKKKIRDNWFPGLVVAPTAQLTVKTNIEFDHLVRSFKDGKYYTISKKDISHFTKEIGARVENPTLKTAVEKAILYIDKDELPPHWDRDLLFGVEKNCVITDSEGILDDYSEEESIEEKDHFVAQLFKFMDDRGTPLNQIPVVHGKDVDLYKLFKVVNTLGGYNKVTKYKQWKIVSCHIGHSNSIYQIKQSYQTYLHSFEDFYRKLGCTMLSHPRGVRSRSRFSRNIIRDIDKSLPSTLTNDKKPLIKQESTDNKINKAEASVKENDDVFKDPMVIKKTTKTTKSEEKLLSKNNDDSKKGDKKKDDNNALRNKSSIKCDPDILDSNGSKIKKDNSKKEDITKPDSTESKKTEKRSYTRNLFGKSMRKNTKSEKIEKVQTIEPGLSSSRKMRSFKDHLKVVVVNVLTPFKKSKRGGAQAETLNKIKPDEDVPKLTRSKSKDDVSSKRKLSVLSDQALNLQVLVPNQSPLKKADGNERKRNVKKKIPEKDEKLISNNSNSVPIGSQAIIDKMMASTITVNDDLEVYYGDKHATTYDAKVLNVCDIEGELKYYVHYKGWNSRYDEWIDISRIASKSETPESGINNSAEPAKIEEKTDKLGKLPSPVSRTRRSITPSTPSNSQTKKSPVNARPTRTCTLVDRSLTTIDNSDSESEYLSNMVITKQYNKRSQAPKPIKTENEVHVKTESLESADNQKKTSHPKTYPSKEVLMQRNVPKSSKSCVFKVQSIKNEISIHCEQVTLNSPIDSIMPSSSNSTKSNLDFENVEIKRENCSNLQNESKIASTHLSPKENSETNNQSVSEIPKTFTCQCPYVRKIDTTGVIRDQWSSEDEDEMDYHIHSKECEQNLLNENPNFKISGTDFDLNKIRLEMRGLMPASLNSHSDIIHSSTPFNLNCIQQIKTEIPKSLPTEDVYEFKEPELCDIQNTTTVVEEKNHRFIENIDQPKLYNFEKPVELPKAIESFPQLDLIVENESVIPFESNSNSANSFDNNVEIDTKMIVTNEIEVSISQSQSEHGFCESENMVIMDSTYKTEILENSIDESCHIELSESEIKDEVLDFSMKPPETPPSTIFHMPETNDCVIVEEEDYDDDDETKLIIAETDKIDSESVVFESHHFLNEQAENSQMLSLQSQGIHQLSDMKSEYIISHDLKTETTLPKDTDDESTVSCNESIQNALIQSFQMYSHFENQPYMDNDDSTKSGYEFELSSKSPTTENVEAVVNEFINNTDNLNEYDLKDLQINEINDKSEREYNNIHPELQCREEIVDDESFNNALVIEYCQKSAEYDIHKSNDSKDFFDSIQQPVSNDGLYETDNYIDIKTSFFDERQTDIVKSVIFDNAPIRSDIYDGNIPTSSSYGHVLSTNENSIYDNPIPGSSKSCFSPEADVNNVLFCEETIPGSPTGLTEEQFEAQRKILMTQDEEREAATTMYSMNQSYHRSLLAAANTNNQADQYINVIPKEEVIDQTHLEFLAEVSSRNPSIEIKTENLVTESETIIREIKTEEKYHTRRKNSNYEYPTSSKRNKTAHVVSSIDLFPKLSETKIPMKDGKPLIAFTACMNSQQRQTLILAKISDLRKEYGSIKSRLSVIDRRRKRIKKRRRELLKLGIMN